MKPKPKIITVTLNPCMDKTVEVADFALGKTNRVLQSRTDIGGKGVNVSRVLAGCGVDFVATGLVAGQNGRKLVDCLEGMDILTAFCEADGETRVNLKIVDVHTGAMTEINEKGFPAGKAFAEFCEALMLFLPEADVLVLSGSVPPDLGDNVYQELTALGNSLGVKVLLDADGALLQKGIASKPYAVKPNKAELETLVGRTLFTTEDILFEAKKLNEQGIDLVVVSLGAEGALFVRDSLAVRTEPLPIEVGSPTGAGDSMVAMLAYATVKNLTLVETAKLMTAAGSLTASLPGTQVCTFAEASEEAKNVRTEILDVE